MKINAQVLFLMSDYFNGLRGTQGKLNQLSPFTDNLRLLEIRKINHGYT